jgi:hypothetical protein
MVVSVSSAFSNHAVTIGIMVSTKGKVVPVLN